MSLASNPGEPGSCRADTAGCTDCSSEESNQEERHMDAFRLGDRNLIAALDVSTTMIMHEMRRNFE